MTLRRWGRAVREMMWNESDREECKVVTENGEE